MLIPDETNFFNIIEWPAANIGSPPNKLINSIFLKVSKNSSIEFSVILSVVRLNEFSFNTLCEYSSIQKSLHLGVQVIHLLLHLLPTDRSKNFTFSGFIDSTIGASAIFSFQIRRIDSEPITSAFLQLLQALGHSPTIKSFLILRNSGPLILLTSGCEEILKLESNSPGTIPQQGLSCP